MEIDMRYIVNLQRAPVVLDALQALYRDTSGSCLRGYWGKRRSSVALVPVREQSAEADQEFQPVPRPRQRAARLLRMGTFRWQAPLL